MREQSEELEVNRELFCIFVVTQPVEFEKLLIDDPGDPFKVSGSKQSLRVLYHHIRCVRHPIEISLEIFLCLLETAKPPEPAELFQFLLKVSQEGQIYPHGDVLGGL